MNKTMKRNVVVSAILAIMLCVSLIVGATFALFTSESKTNIAVTSGKVDVRAEITDFKASHPKTITLAAQPSEEYENGFTFGSASYDPNTNEIDLDKMVAGDKVSFTIVIKNYSTVAVKFRTTYKIDGDEDLQNSLNVSAGESTGWLPLGAASENGSVVNTLDCYVELPCDANEDVQGKACTVSFTVEAVQGNADVPVAGTFINNVSEFMAFANDVNGGNTYAGETVYLLSDIDLSGENFKGIGSKHASGHAFEGTFDGQNHTISGIEFKNVCPDYDDNGALQNGCDAQCEIGEIADSAAGLFNQTNGATIKNVVVKGAKISSAHYVGGIVGYALGKTQIENCKTVASTLTSKVIKACGETDGGNMAGGIVGFTYSGCAVNKCSVSNTTITAYRDLGAIAGNANTNVTIKNCIIGDNVIVKVDRSENYKNYTTATKYNAGNVVGRIDPEDVDTVIVTGNTGSAKIWNADYYIATADELFEVAMNVNGNTNYYNNKTIQLVADIDLENRAWTPIGKTSNCEFRGTFDGNGYIIKNLSITEADDADTYAGIGLFGWVGNNGGGKGYIKNVTINGATVSGHRYVGALVGYLQFGSVENCIVKNATVVCTHKDADRCGDKAGAVIGFVAPNDANSTVSVCKAEDCTVKAARDAGQVIGMAYTSQEKITDLSASNVKVSEVENNTCNDKPGKMVQKDWTKRQKTCIIKIRRRL